MLLTAIELKTAVSTVSFGKPTVVCVSEDEIFAAVPFEKGTKIIDRLGRNSFIVLETPEQIEKMRHGQTDIV